MEAFSLKIDFELLRGELADGTTRLWSVKEGIQVIPTLQHDDSVDGAAFNSDETLILTWSADGTARLWNAKNGTLVIPPLHHKQIQGALFNPEETLILTWGEDRVAKLWHASSGSPATPSLQLDSVAVDARFSHDGNLVLIWTGDGSTARLWNTKDGAAIGTPIEHDAGISGANFSEDRQLVTIWSDISYTARVWRTKDGSPASMSIPYYNDEYDEWVVALYFDRDRIIYGIGNSGIVHAWHIRDTTLVFPPIKHEGKVNGARLSHDGKLILTWTADGSTHLWHAEDGTPAVPAMRHDDSIIKATFSKDDHLILTSSTDGTARLWHVNDGTPAAPPMEFDGIGLATFSPDENLIVAGSMDGVIRLWHTKDGGPLPFSIKHASLKAFTFSEDSRLLLTLSEDTIRVWQTKDGSLLAQYMRPGESIKGAKLSHDGQKILSWSDEGTAWIWHVQDSSFVSPPMIHHDKSMVYYSWEDQKVTKRLDTTISGATFSPDETVIATWGTDATIKIWRTDDYSLDIKPMKHEGMVEKVIFNEEGTLILSKDSADKVYLWHNDGTQATLPMSHDTQFYMELTGVDFSHDERLILSWGKDGRALIWHAQDGTLFKTLTHDKPVLGAIFNEDDSQVLTLSEDGIVRLWDIGADYDFPKESLPLLVQVMTGTTINELGNVRGLKQGEWETLNQRYRSISEEHLKTCQYQKNNLDLIRKKVSERLQQTANEHPQRANDSQNKLE